MLAVAWPFAVVPLILILRFGWPRSRLGRFLFDGTPRRFRPGPPLVAASLVLLTLDFAADRALRATTDAGSGLLAMDVGLLAVTLGVAAVRPLSNRGWWMVATGVDVVLLLGFNGFV